MTTNTSAAEKIILKESTTIKAKACVEYVVGFVAELA